MSIEKLFGKNAEIFDRDRRALIPCYDDFYNFCVDVIPYHSDRELRVLDLGAGTGLLTYYVAAQYPFANFALVDVSEEMLSMAEKRLNKTDSPGRFTYRVMDYAKDPFKGQYDLVMSSLSIHHLDSVAKQQLFEKIYDLLEPGGVFINGDQVLGESEMAEKKFRHVWLEQVKANGVSEEALSAALERMREDKMSTLSDQLIWLEKAQFVDVTNWYQYYSFVVYSGIKPIA